MRDSEKLAALEGELAALKKAATALYRFDWVWEYDKHVPDRPRPTAGWALWRDLRDALGFDHYQKWRATQQIAEMRRLDEIECKNQTGIGSM